MVKHLALALQHAAMSPGVAELQGAAAQVALAWEMA